MPTVPPFPPRFFLLPAFLSAGSKTAADDQTTTARRKHSESCAAAIPQPQLRRSPVLVGLLTSHLVLVNNRICGAPPRRTLVRPASLQSPNPLISQTVRCLLTPWCISAYLSSLKWDGPSSKLRHENSAIVQSAPAFQAPVTREAS